MPKQAKGEITETFSLSVVVRAMAALEMEQLTLNQRVQGSSPGAPTKTFRKSIAYKVVRPTLVVRDSVGHAGVTRTKKRPRFSACRLRSSNRILQLWRVEKIASSAAQGFASGVLREGLKLGPCDDCSTAAAKRLWRAECNRRFCTSPSTNRSRRCLQTSPTLLDKAPLPTWSS
jgi:hypothetical protein